MRSPGGIRDRHILTVLSSRSADEVVKEQDFLSFFFLSFLGLCPASAEPFVPIRPVYARQHSTLLWTLLCGIRNGHFLHHAKHKSELIKFRPRRVTLFTYCRVFHCLLLSCAGLTDGRITCIEQLLIMTRGK
jgi:hypothetical protein